MRHATRPAKSDKAAYLASSAEIREALRRVSNAPYGLNAENRRRRQRAWKRCKGYFLTKSPPTIHRYPRYPSL